MRNNSTYYLMLSDIAWFDPLFHLYNFQHEIRKSYNSPIFLEKN